MKRPGGRDDKRSGRKDHAQDEKDVSPGKYACHYKKYGCTMTFGSKSARNFHSEFCDKNPN